MENVRNVERLFGDDYGILTFTGENIRRRLSPAALRRLDQTTQYNEPLDEAIADGVRPPSKELKDCHGERLCPLLPLVSAIDRGNR